MPPPSPIYKVSWRASARRPAADDRRARRRSNIHAFPRRRVDARRDPENRGGPLEPHAARCLGTGLAKRQNRHKGESTCIRFGVLADFGLTIRAGADSDFCVDLPKKVAFAQQVPDGGAALGRDAAPRIFDRGGAPAAKPGRAAEPAAGAPGTGPPPRLANRQPGTVLPPGSGRQMPNALITGYNSGSEGPSHAFSIQSAPPRAGDPRVRTGIRGHARQRRHETVQSLGCCVSPALWAKSFRARAWRY